LFNKWIAHNVPSWNVKETKKNVCISLRWFLTASDPWKSFVIYLLLTVIFMPFHFSLWNYCTEKNLWHFSFNHHNLIKYKSWFLSLCFCNIIRGKKSSYIHVHGLFTSIYIKKKLNQLHTRHSNLNQRGIFNKEGFVCTVSEIIGKFR
jgi:hypothetical protein